MSLEPAVEAHQQSEVDENLRAVRAVADRIASEMGVTVTATVVPDDAEVPPGCKKVHFIRHGEGHHNVVQREWRARADWDGASEPYTLDTDPEYRFVDALLTEKGEAEASALQARTRRVTPQLLVVSPLRRATQTGLLAFEHALPPSPSRGGAPLPVVAHELCHAGQWLLDGARKPPHGAAFQKWASRFEARVDGMASRGGRSQCASPLTRRRAHRR